MLSRPQVKATRRSASYISCARCCRFSIFVCCLDDILFAPQGKYSQAVRLCERSPAICEKVRTRYQRLITLGYCCRDSDAPQFQNSACAKMPSCLPHLGARSPMRNHSTSLVRRARRRMLTAIPQVCQRQGGVVDPLFLRGFTCHLNSLRFGICDDISGTVG